MPAIVMPPPCLQCGTCCFSDSDEYVTVSGNDHERLGDDADHYVEFVGNRPICACTTATARLWRSIDSGEDSSVACTIVVLKSAETWSEARLNAVVNWP